MRKISLYLITLLVLSAIFVGMGNIAYAKDIKNLLVNSYFAQGITGWTLECQDPFVRADIMSDSSTKVIGEYSMLTDMREIQGGAELWRSQPKQTGIELRSGQKYTWSFWAKAEQERDLQCQVLVDVWDWRLLGLDEPVTVTPEWKEYFKTFTCTEDYSNARITWLCAHALIDFWIDNVILYEGDYVEGLMADQLESKPASVGQRSTLTTTWGKTKGGQ